MKRLVLSPIIAALLVCACLAQPALGANPVTIGQTPTTYSPTGGCAASILQLADSGSSSYVLPHSGVLTKTQVYVGPSTTPGFGEWMRAQTFRTIGPSGATVIGQGDKHVVEGLTAGQHTFADRIPATVGDVLGARFSTTPFIEGTPCLFPAAAGDTAGTGNGTDPGGSLTATSVPSHRINVLATLESDDDHDGYGDSTQDLCPGSPLATTACSGALFGSRLDGVHEYTGGCGFACLRVQKTFEGHSTAAPVDGVVVRWRLLGAGTGSYRVRVIAPTSGGEYMILHSSDAGAVTTEPLLTEKISSFQTRLPIPAGGYVALAPPPSAALGAKAPVSGTTYATFNDHVADGALVPEAGPATSLELLYDADIEPDADHDGYGDLTQDSCPSDGSRQGACVPLPNPPPPPSKPKIDSFKATPKRFRVKPGGAVVSVHRAHAGTTLRLSLSEDASVAFEVEESVPCKPVKKPKRCGKPKWTLVHVFERSLQSGKSAIAYSGRYKKGGVTKGLSPGSYRVSAVATNADGKSSAASLTAMTVVR